MTANLTTGNLFRCRAGVCPRLRRLSVAVASATAVAFAGGAFAQALPDPTRQVFKDATGIEISYDEGMLRITLPKARGNRVEIPID